MFWACYKLFFISTRVSKSHSLWQCLSVRPSIHPSVRQTICSSVHRPSVRHAVEIFANKLSCIVLYAALFPFLPSHSSAKSSLQHNLRHLLSHVSILVKFRAHYFPTYPSHNRLFHLLRFFPILVKSPACDDAVLSFFIIRVWWGKTNCCRLRKIAANPYNGWPKKICSFKPVRRQLHWG